MKKICEHCIHNACAYKTRGLENKCEKVQDYEQGYADAVEKATSYIQQHWIWNTKIIEDFKNYMERE